MINLNDLAKPAEDFTGNVKDYINLKEDQLKLQTTRIGSVTIARLLSSILILNLALLVLVLLAFTLILCLGDIVGSYALGAGIVTAAFAVLLAVLFARRRKLFVSSFIKMFISLFYNEDSRQ